MAKLKGLIDARKWMKDWVGKIGFVCLAPILREFGDGQKTIVPWMHLVDWNEVSRLPAFTSPSAETRDAILRNRLKIFRRFQPGILAAGF